ncbi:MAG TPA: molybdopterin converting factor subunit 1 [Stenotrophomonas sp.]|jgi:molybdopterin synthase sulfur carrier subunit
MSVVLQVLYFASLRDAAGTSQESVQTTAGDLAGLYEELAARHALRWPRAQLRVAVDGAFVDWSQALRHGSEVVFIPPVSGG